MQITVVMHAYKYDAVVMCNGHLAGENLQVAGLGDVLSDVMVCKIVDVHGVTHN